MGPLLSVPGVPKPGTPLKNVVPFAVDLEATPDLVELSINWKRKSNKLCQSWEHGLF